MDKPEGSRSYRNQKYEAICERATDRALRISKVIIETFGSNLDDFPWRRAESPWQVLLAEVLLQRVPAERVLKVYEVLVELAPTPKDFLSVPEDKVKRILSTLGLQNKKYELLRKIALKLSYEDSKVQDLREVKGLGRFGRAVFEVFVLRKSSALVDEVVGRVFSRVLGIDIRGKAINDKRLWNIMEMVAKNLTVEELKKLFYGAVDLGRKVCKVKDPACDICPLANLCKYQLKSRESRL